MSAREIRLRANAKLNLTLDITGLRADGYHLMDMVNISADLSDMLTIRLGAHDGVRITSNARFLPRTEKNLVYKAAAALCERRGELMPPLEFDIQKRIPTQAGLGGGSADAAAALIGLNRLLDFGFSREELCAVGERVGADVPYCLIGGAARVTGIGEIIEPVPNAADFSLVILMPREGRSTKEIFSRYDTGGQLRRPDTAAMLRALAAGDTSAAALQLCNVFQSAAPDALTEKLIEKLRENGALGASMTGTGAAVFGIFADGCAANACKRRLFGAGARVYTARPRRDGVEIISIR